MTYDPTRLNGEITGENLHAFLDGQLNAEDSKFVGDWLEANPDVAAELMEYADQNAAIQALYPEPTAVPDLGAMAKTPAPANRNSAPWSAIAASVVTLGIGLTLGWTGHDTLAPTPQPDATQVAVLVAEAVRAHALYSVDPHRPVEIGADQSETMVRWLSNRVGTPVSAPDLTKNGYMLVGGRLISAAEGPAAQFMYEDETGRRITLFATQGSGHEASFNYTRQGDTGSFYWQDATLSYALTGDVTRSELSDLAISVFDQGV